MLSRYEIRVDVVRNGATLTTLHSLTPPSIDCDSGAAIKMSMSADFIADSSVNWLTDELLPIQVIDGKDYPVGYFPVGTVVTSHDSNGLETVSVEAYDRCMILNQTKTEAILHFSAGDSYLGVVESLLLEAGLALHVTSPNEAVLRTDREDWPIGTPYLTIINQLLAEINYASIWFDSRGYAHLEELKVPSVSNIKHCYTQTDKTRVLARPSVIEQDAFDAPNVFVAICANPDFEAPLIATAVNDNPMSALSVLRRGRRIVQVYQVNNVPDQAALEAYVSQRKFEGMMSSEIVTIETVKRPGHGVFDTVALSHPDASGIFQEVGWSMVLDNDSLMTHRLKRSVIL